MKNVHCLLLASLLIATPLLSLAEKAEQNPIHTEQIEELSNHSVFRPISALCYGVSAIGLASSIVGTIGIGLLEPNKLPVPLLTTLCIYLNFLYYKTAYELAVKDEQHAEKYKDLLGKYNTLKEDLA